jgi:hypothetical protein
MGKSCFSSTARVELSTIVSITFHVPKCARTPSPSRWARTHRWHSTQRKSAFLYSGLALNFNALPIVNLVLSFVRASRQYKAMVISSLPLARSELRVKAQLARAVWSEDRVYSRGVRDDSLAQLVRRLREKIEPDPAHPRFILTVPGRGYRYVSQASGPGSSGG